MKRLFGPFLVLLAGTAAAWVLRSNARPLRLLHEGPPMEDPLPSPRPYSALSPRPGRPFLPSGRIPLSPPGPRPIPALQPGRPYLSGRIIDARGTPQARRMWRFTFLGRRSGSADARLVPAGTDGKGRFLVPFPAGREEETEVTLQIRPMASDGRATGGATARKILLSGYPPGVTTLGDLVIREEPLLAAGRVIDPSGNPLEGVEVQAWVERFLPCGVDRGNRGASPRTWLPLPCSSRTGRDGTFKIRGECAASLIQLRASGNGWFQEDPPILSPGSTSLILTLSPGGRIEGKLLPPPGAAPRNFLLRLTPPHGKGGPGPSSSPSRRRTVVTRSRESRRGRLSWRSSVSWTAAIS